MQTDNNEFNVVASKLQQALEIQEKELAEHKQTSTLTAKTISTLSAELKSLQTNMAERFNKVAATNSVSGYQYQPPASVGKSFTESTQYKTFIENGHITNSAPYNTNQSFTNLVRKDSYSSGQAIAEGYIQPTRIVAPNSMLGIMMPLEEELVLQDFMRRLKVSTPTFSYMKEKVWNNNASVVPEFTQDGTQTVNGAAFPAPAGHAYNDGSGNWLTKPRSDFEFEEVQTNIKTLAHYISVTRQALEDAPFVSDWINQKLLVGLRKKVEHSLFFGAGGANDLQGIATLAGKQTYIQTASETKIDALRKAMTKLFVGVYRPNVIYLNHYDWAAIELLKDSNDRYIWANPKVQGVPTLWSLPCIASNSIPQGEFYMGDFANGMAILDRSNVSIRIGEPDNMFLRNLLAILAEERLGVAHFREDAFLKGTFI